MTCAISSVAIRIRHWVAPSCMRVFTLVCCMGYLWSLSGCSSTGERQAIEGEVTLDSKPLPEGYITFSPIEGTRGPSSGSKISNGRYRIAAKDGIFWGKFRVEIRASRPSGRQVKRPPLNDMVDEFVEYLPARYHDRSELTAQVNADAEKQLNFALRSK